MAPGRRNNDQRLNSADHDLLITIAERLRGLVETCNGLVISLGQKADLTEIASLRVDTARTSADFETRIRVLEQFNWKQAGGYGLILVLIGFALRFWK